MLLLLSDWLRLCLHGTESGTDPVRFLDRVGLLDRNGSQTGPAILQVQLWIRSRLVPEQSRVNTWIGSKRFHVNWPSSVRNGSGPVPCKRSLTVCLTDCLTYYTTWLAAWLTGWLTDLLYYLTDWPPDCLPVCQWACLSVCLTDWLLNLTWELRATKDLWQEACCLTTAGGSSHWSLVIGQWPIMLPPNSGTSLRDHVLPSIGTVT